MNHIPTWRLLLKLGRTNLRLTLTHATLWTLIHMSPLLPGLVAYAFFDTLTGDADPPGGTTGLIALLMAIGIVQVVLIFAAGAWFAWSPGKAHAVQDQKLNARREKLLAEIVALEKKRQTKPLSESDEARLQRATTELERVIAELDRGVAA